jgi:hypothetical protein
MDTAEPSSIPHIQITPAMETAIIELRGLGLTYPAISSRFGVSKQRVQWTCLKHRATLPAIGKPPKHKNSIYVRSKTLIRRFTPEEDIQLMTFALDGEKECVIARRLGRKHTSISARLFTLGLKTPKAKGAGAQ